ncbi:glycoside hydrolase family 16 protein [Sparassis latifolia]
MQVSPRSSSRSTQPPPAHHPSQSNHNTHRDPSAPQPIPPNNFVSQRSDTAYSVATGAIGGGYGPYSYNPSSVTNGASRFSAAPSEASVTTGDKTTSHLMSASVPPYPYLWDNKDSDVDDPLHDPDPVRDAKEARTCTIFSARGWLNLSALTITILALLTLFAGYPIIRYYAYPPPYTPGFNIGGINSSGQIPNLPGLPTLIDKDTPRDAYSHVASDGSTYNLMFSDEFETDGRTFWPGDDPYWEAVDLDYWPTADLEWYSPDAITTANGKLVITISEVENHSKNFRSGMLQSWNKICFTTGYIEMSISLPGAPTAPGFWPAAWTMGNLGRAGYGATTEGMWPYTYAACDVGTFPNQTSQSGVPAGAATGGPGGGPISYQPGQKLSACSCPGSDHPGPSVNVGRGVPEVDVIEAQIDPVGFRAEASQSMQVAPYNFQYEFANDSTSTPIYNETGTFFNSYKGGIYQQAVSAVTYINGSNYNDAGYAKYAYEWYSNPDNREAGYITWFADGQQTWKVTPATLGPDSITQISGRLIPEEPMYMVLNLGMAPSFEAQDFEHLVFPSQMFIDYVRVYQRSDVSNGLTCDPPRYPTADYIERHLNAYTNPNLTTWAQAGYQFPLNSKYNGCS